MITKSVKTAPIWISTDCEGQIEETSQAAHELLGGRPYGQNLSRFFPSHATEIAFDREVALTGWPSRRMVMLEPWASRWLVVEYVVNTRFTTGSVQLYWFFDLLAVGRRDNVH